MRSCANTVLHELSWERVEVGGAEIEDIADERIDAERIDVGSGAEIGAITSRRDFSVASVNSVLIRECA